MDILGDKNEREQNLNLFKSNECLFTEMKNSTCSAEGFFTGVTFHEANLSEHLITTKDIVRIDSNYIHLINAGYEGLEKKKTSNRGRRKKQKQKKNRKMQGDGSKFNSCIQFCILGTHIREIPEEDDMHTHNTTPLPSIIKNDCEIKMEKILKEYKVKLFRTGRIQVPGVLTEDMSDVLPPLTKLRKYLDWMFVSDVQIIDLFSVMRNYKFKLKEGHIDLRILHKYGADEIVKCMIINYGDLVKAIIKPLFAYPQEIHPFYEGWKGVLDMYDHPDIDRMGNNDLTLNIDQIKKNLENGSDRNIYVDPENLETWINEINLPDYYKKFMQYMILFPSNMFDEFSMGKILKFYLTSPLSKLYKKITTHKDNDMASVKYDPSNYPGLLMKVKTPLPGNSTKRTTIKIFPKGKINIDGANNREEADFIYWWLNDLFTKKPEFIYDEDYIHNETDSEFSESEELSETDVESMSMDLIEQALL